MNINVNIPADGTVQPSATGSFNYLRILSATLPFQISFDGSDWRDAENNSSFDNGGSRVYFRAANGLASTVVFAVSKTPFTSTPSASTDQASTTVRSNIDQTDNGAATATLPLCDANGYLRIDNSKLYLVSGNKNGQRRQKIIITTRTNDLSIKTAANRTGVVLQAPGLVTLETDSDIYLVGTAAADSFVTVFETFLKNNS